VRSALRRVREEGETSDGKQGKRREGAELGKALNLNEIPESSTQFLAMVSSPAYKMRHRLEQSLTATELDGGSSALSTLGPPRTSAAALVLLIHLPLLLLLLLLTLLKTEATSPCCWQLAAG